MARLSLQTSPTVKVTNTHRLVQMLKLANVMSLPEKDFSNLVNKIETNPLFKKYLNPTEGNNRLFGYKRFPKTKASTGFLELNENLATGSVSTGVEAYLDDKKEIITLCQKIGMENFRNFFLYNEGGRPLEEIAQECHLTVDEVQKAMDLVNHVALQEEFQTQAPQGADLHEHYTKIGHFEIEPSGEFTVKYTSLRYARGRYTIDYDKLVELKDNKILDREEYRDLKKLIKSMELINARKSTLYQILSKVTERQREFLHTQNSGQLQSLTQLELARELDIHSSTISRAIYGKSVVTPWNEEIPLKVFLVKGPVNKIKAAIYQIVSQEEKLIQEKKLPLPYRDEEIKNLLQTDYRMTIATRTVAKYRAELDISNVYDRMNTYRANFSKAT